MATTEMADTAQFDLLTVAANKVGLPTTSRILFLTREWMKGKQTTKTMAVSSAVLLSCIVEAFSTGSSVGPTENDPNGSKDTSHGTRAGGTTSSDQSKPRNAFSNASSSGLTTNNKAIEAEKCNPGVSAMDVEDGEDEEKRRDYSSRTINTESTQIPPNLCTYFEVARLVNCVSIANTMAEFLAECKADNAKKEPHPTVSQVAYECLQLVAPKWPSDASSPSFFQAVIQASAQGEANEQVWNLILETSLQQIQKSSKCAVESLADFDYMWKACAGEGVNGCPNFKQSAWKLSCVLTLQQHRSLFLVDLKSATHPDEASLAKAKRRKRILTSAACMGLFLLLSSETSLNSGGGVRTTDNRATQSTKTPTIGERKESNEENENPPFEVAFSEVSPDSGKRAATSSLHVKRRRLAIEDEAIAALSMMVSGSSSGSSSPNSWQPSPPHPVDREKIVDTIVSAAKRLHGRLATQHVMGGPSLSKKELEDEILRIAMQDAAKPLLQGAKELSTSFYGRLRSVLPNEHFSPTKIEEMFVKANMELIGALDTTMSSSNTLGLEAKRATSVIKWVPYVDEFAMSSADTSTLLRFYTVVESRGAANLSDDNALVVPHNGYDPHGARNVVSPSVITVSSEPRELSKLVSSLKSCIWRKGVTTDAMELNEWTLCILTVSSVKPNARLLMYLDASDDEVSSWKIKNNLVGLPESLTRGWRSVIFPVLDRILDKIDGAGSRISNQLGEVRFAMSHDGETSMQSYPDWKIPNAVVSLYYHVLEVLLFQETARLKSAAHPGLIQNEAFHRALLACSYTCVLKAVGFCSKQLLGGLRQMHNLKSILKLMECTPYAYLKVSEAFLRALKLEPSSLRGMQRISRIGLLPCFLRQHMMQCQVSTTDSLLWSRECHINAVGGNIMDEIKDLQGDTLKGDGQQSHWPPRVLMPTLPAELMDIPERTSEESVPNTCKSAKSHPEHRFVEYVFRSILSVSHLRISALCNELEVPMTVASQVWIAFRYLLRHNVELLYDRHIDQLVLCTLYGVSRILKLRPELSFSVIIEAYCAVRKNEIGECECQKRVRHVRILPENAPDQTGKTAFGSVIDLYNKVFIPKMKTYLMQSKSLKKTACDLQTATESDHCSFINVDGKVVSSTDGNFLDPGATMPATVVVGNVQLSLGQWPFAPSAFAGETPRSYTEEMMPKTRAFYSFGGASAMDLKRVNRTLLAGEKTPPW